MKIGYARVSTEAQNLDRQIDALTKCGVDRRNIYQEKYTGTAISRPIFDRMIDELQPGDIIYVTDLSRISRSRNDLLDIIETISHKGATLISLVDTWFNMDKNDAFSKLLLSFIASLNEFERNLLSERSKEGVAAARQRGKHPGRPKGLNAEVIKQVRSVQQLCKDGNMSVSEACRTLQLSRATYYHYKRNL